MLFVFLAGALSFPLLLLELVGVSITVLMDILLGLGPLGR
jgi:hypothetical protein